MKNFKDFFFFSKGERRGVAVLLVLTAVFTAARIAVAQSRPKSPVAVAKTASRPGFKKYEAPRLYIELNTADTLLLTELRGIGPGYARRIVGFRRQLGGFYCKEQLLDVYGFTDELYAKVEAQVWADSTKVERLAVNRLGVAQLKRHPYIGYYQALALVEAREAAGGRLEGLHQIPLGRDIDADCLERLSHYLSFEE